MRTAAPSAAPSAALAAKLNPPAMLDGQAAKAARADIFRAAAGLPAATLAAFDRLTDWTSYLDAELSHGGGKTIPRQFYDYAPETGETVAAFADPAKKYLGVELEYNAAFHLAPAVWALALGDMHRRAVTMGRPFALNPSPAATWQSGTVRLKETADAVGAELTAVAIVARDMIRAGRAVDLSALTPAGATAPAFQLDSGSGMSNAPRLALAPFFAPESDGSLVSGLEITTQPATLAWWCSPIGRRALGNLLAIMRAGGAKIKHGGQSNAGMHVHVSRGALTVPEAMALNWAFNAPEWAPMVEAIAGRSVNEWCHRDADGRSQSTAHRLKPHPTAWNEYQREKETTGVGGSAARYRTLNFTNSKTLEVRLFASTANPDKALARLQFIGALTDTAKREDRRNGNPYVSPGAVREYVAKKARGYGELKAALSGEE